MHAGNPSGVTAGFIDDAILDWVEVDSPSGLGKTVYFTPATTEGNQYWVAYCDGVLQEIRWVKNYNPLNPVYNVFNFVFDPTKDRHSLSLTPISADWNNVNELTLYDDDVNFESDKGNTVEITFNAVIEEIEAYNDLQSFNSWVLTGLTRWENVARYSKTEGRLDIRVITYPTDGLRYIFLYNGKSAVAYGTQTLNTDGTVDEFLATGGTEVGELITLTEVNESGVNGFVRFEYKQDLVDSDSSFMVCRWAKKYELHVGETSNFVFPRTPEKTVTDDGASNAFTGYVPNLAAGIYYYLIRTVSDTNVTSTNEVHMGEIEIATAPEPATDLSVVSEEKDYTTHGDLGQLTNWVINGLDLGVNCQKISGIEYRLNVTFTAIGPIRTLYLFNDDVLVASGWRSGDGNLTFTEQGSSGISGTVDVVFTTELALGSAYVEIDLTTVISFQASTTAGVHYHIHDSVFLDEPVRYDESIATLTGTGVISYTLPELSFESTAQLLTGFRRVAVEVHNADHTSDGHKNQIRINYLDGRLNMAPNIPGNQLVYVTGLSVCYNYTYSDYMEEIAPSRIEIWAENNDVNQEAFLVGTAVFTSNSGSIIGTVFETGWYRFIIYAVSSSNTYSKSKFSVPIYCSDFIPSVPDGVTAKVRA